MNENEIFENEVTEVDTIDQIEGIEVEVEAEESNHLADAVCIAGAAVVGFAAHWAVNKIKPAAKKAIGNIKAKVEARKAKKLESQSEDEVELIQFEDIEVED